MCHECDVKIAERVHEIRDRYDIMVEDPEEEDFEEIGRCSSYTSHG